MASLFSNVTQQLEEVVATTLIPLVLTHAREDAAGLVRSVLSSIQKTGPLTPAQKAAATEEVNAFVFHHGAYTDLLRGRFDTFGPSLPRTPVPGPLDVSLFPIDEEDAEKDVSPPTAPVTAEKPKKPRAPRKTPAPATEPPTPTPAAAAEKPKKPRAAPRKTAQPAPVPDRGTPDVIEEEDDEDTQPFDPCATILEGGKRCPFPALPGSVVCKRCTPPAPKKK